MEIPIDVLTGLAQTRCCIKRLDGVHLVLTLFSVFKVSPRWKLTLMRAINEVSQMDLECRILPINDIITSKRPLRGLGE